jgi:predicted PurR-regulated permease PerM
MSGASPTPPWAIFLTATAALVALWILGQTIGHVLIVFGFSMILALLLNPAVRMLRRLRVPRGIAVMMVFLLLIGTVGAAAALLYSPVRGQVEEIQKNLPAYTDQANRQVEGLQQFFDDRGIGVDVKERLGDLIVAVEERAAEATDNLLSYSLDLLGVFITLIIIVVSTVYMLLDAPRIQRFSQRLGGPAAGAFLRRTERTLVEYMKAQILVSMIIGTSSGLVLWLYGVTGIFPLGATFAVAFATWVFFMEFIPYVGPILGAVPPVLLALVTSPVAALWVIVAFLAIHQIEGHLVVPKVMGDAVGVHPLVVIFGLLIGEQLAGLVGVLIAIPMVVVVKEAATFASDQLFQRREARAASPVPPPPAPRAQDAADPGPPPTAERPAAMGGGPAVVDG